ncbi:Rubrerythrin [Thermococcus sp. 2319x1]|uniref:ferritin-like domain-containing protein n=1 Tax=Thermococcus sp. 2319x1 TaxID=1674923 RepID=UPI00073AA486|nr:ferritin family protein [Thermococcus sp. 2319x1]ALV63699.1 Rubrerythrin [Thermococcus sp. 2319x1]
MESGSFTPEDLEVILDKLKKLDEKSLLAYWIKGEHDEAEFYEKLAQRAKELGLPESLVETFIILSKESKEHGDTLRNIFLRNYGEEPIPPDLPPIEVAPLLDKFERAEDVFEVLKLAMESELLAKKLYTHLAENEKREEFKKIYLILAAVESSHYERLKGEFEILKKLKRRKNPMGSLLVLGYELR